MKKKKTNITIFLKNFYFTSWFLQSLKLNRVSSRLRKYLESFWNNAVFPKQEGYYL